MVCVPMARSRIRTAVWLFSVALLLGLAASILAAMELSASDAAKRLLDEWASGAPAARLTIDAKAALRRITPSR